MKQKLILDFTKLSGPAKQVVMEYVQRELFKMGFSWFGSKVLSYLYANFIIVGCSDIARHHLSYTIGKYNDCDAKIFDVTKDLEEFFLAAKKSLVVHTVIIEGVKVTMTPDKIIPNYNDLIYRVRQKAGRIHKELFGV